MEKIRNLHPEEIAVLQSQGCYAENWGQVLDPLSFETRYIHHVHFSGTVILGHFEKEFTLPQRAQKYNLA